MGRKAKYKYGVQDIAEASKRDEKAVVLDINSGKLDYSKLVDTAEYIVSALNPFIGELIKSSKQEEPF